MNSQRFLPFRFAWLLILMFLPLLAMRILFDSVQTFANNFIYFLKKWLNYPPL